MLKKPPGASPAFPEASCSSCGPARTSCQTPRSAPGALVPQWKSSELGELIVRSCQLSHTSPKLPTSTQVLDVDAPLLEGLIATWSDRTSAICPRFASSRAWRAPG